MRGIGFSGKNVSLDAWLFGEEHAQQPSQQPHQLQHRRPPSSSSSTETRSIVGNRSQSLPANHLSHRAHPSKTATPTASPSRLPAVPSRTTAAPTKAPPADLSGPFPVSAKLRKLFRPNRLQWNKSRLTNRSTDDKRRQLLGIPSSSFQRLQGHVPFTLKEIVKDPKKLPYLLQWLSTDDTAQTNYHQVLLFLLEIEQLQLVAEEKRRDQARKIWYKYIDNDSEFQISTTLELTTELQQLVLDSIDCQERTLDAFFPIQKLAYMRLTREEMPRFLKSSEYLQMLIDTEHDTESVPMERILEQPRAAHYFLLFLMQSRQHFELYFWLHVEYVLKPLLESENYQLFWRLARVLVHKAQNDSQALTLATKNDLERMVESRRLDEKNVPQQPAVKALLSKAQQEIFVMLRSSWFDRFMKSNLYKVALNDPLIHLDREESKEDSPPKLLSRSFTGLEYASRQANDEESTQTTEIDGQDKGLIPNANGSGHNKNIPEGSKEDGDESEDDSDESSSSESEEAEFSGMVLNLESIIRVTKLPDGLQVHYRPHYEPAAANIRDSSKDEYYLDTILTFATFVEKHDGAETKANLMLMPVINHGKESSKSFDEITRRVKAFLVPDGRIIIKRTRGGSKRPKDILFPFQQSGRDGFLFGSVYLTYEVVRVGTDNEEMFVAKGVCVLSHQPLVNSLRNILEQHVLNAKEPADVFAHDRLTALFNVDLGPKKDRSSSMHGEHALQLIRKHSSVTSLPLSALGTRVDVSMKPLLQHFGSALVLQILASALLECSIVVVSSQYTLLTVCTEAIRSLLRPFSWCHVYAPVLPKPLLSYLQCPTPILVGVHSEYALRSELPTSSFCLVADMDRQVVEFVGNQSVSWRRMGLEDDRPDRLFLPRSFEVAKRELDKLLMPNTLWYDAVGGGEKNSTPRGEGEREYSDDQVRLICYEAFIELLSGHTNACLVVGDTKESVVIFDETQFLSTQAPEDLPFFKALMRSQCFSEIISAHRINMNLKEIDDNVEGIAMELNEGII